MIIVKLMGGFASQFGKYAWTKKLAEDYHTDFMVEISDYVEGYFRPFVLNYLNLPDCKVIKSIGEIDAYINIPNGSTLLEKVGEIRHENLFISGEEQDYECFFEKHPEYRIAPDWKVFHDFGLRDQSKYVEEFQSIIKEEYSVAVHIRRGDFVGLGWNDEIKDYQEAIGAIMSTNPKACFYFFSNDIAWVENRFGSFTKFKYIKNSNGVLGDLEEFVCMAYCNLRIISSLSGYSKYANYLSYSLKKDTDGAILLNESKSGVGIVGNNIEDWTVKLLSEEEKKKGYTEYIRYINESPDIKEDKEKDIVRDETIQENNSSKRNVIIFTNEIMDKWMIKDVYMIAHLLAKRGENVLYINVNARNDYMSNTHNQISRAKNPDGLDLGFDIIPIAEKPSKIISNIRKWMNSDKRNGRTVDVYTIYFGRKKKYQYLFVFILLKLLYKSTIFPEIKMLHPQKESGFKVLMMSDVLQKEAETLFSAKYMDIVEEIEANGYKMD